MRKNTLDIKEVALEKLKVEKFFKQWTSWQTQVERYYKLIPTHKAIIDYLIDKSVVCGVVTSYKEPKIYELRIVGYHETYVFSYRTTLLSDYVLLIDYAYEAILLPLELKLTDARPWVRLLANYEVGREDRGLINETNEYLKRKDHWEPAPWHKLV